MSVLRARYWFGGQAFDADLLPIPTEPYPAELPVVVIFRRARRAQPTLIAATRRLAEHCQRDKQQRGKMPPELHSIRSPALANGWAECRATFFLTRRLDSSPTPVHVHLRAACVLRPATSHEVLA